MPDVFVFGSLLEAQVRRAVLGREAAPAITPARLPGYCVQAAGGWRGASLRRADPLQNLPEASGALAGAAPTGVNGALLTLDQDGADRLAYLMQVLGARADAVTVRGRAATAYSWDPQAPDAPGTAAWDQQAWANRWGAVVARGCR